MHAAFSALLLLSQTLAEPPEPLKGQLQSAIWSDLQRNAMIGNGNWVAGLWYNAGGEDDEALHIRALRCTPGSARRRCAFELIRDGSPKQVLGETAPVHLRCFARFVRAKGAWSVVHTPPKHVGHSKTSMACEALP